MATSAKDDATLIDEEAIARENPFRQPLGQYADAERQVAYQLASIYLAANVAKYQLAVFTDIETRLNEAYRISGALAENPVSVPKTSDLDILHLTI